MKTHGIRPFISAFNIFQLPIHFVFISQINRIAYDFTINPAILTDGVLWFKDLSAPDPYGILPIAGAALSLLNIMQTSSSGGAPIFRKFKKFFKFFPIIAVPVWMTFPAAFNIYWMCSAFCQLTILSLFRIASVRKFFGIPRYLPNSKLERLNVKQRITKPVSQGQKQVILSNKPKTMK